MGEGASDGRDEIAGFAYSLASDTGGEESPIAAAEAAASPGQVDENLPRGDWTVTSTGPRVATVASGDWELHVVQGADDTWQVDSGQQRGC